MSRFLASVAGVGYAPYAPGTVGSAVAVVTGAGLLAWSPWALATGAAAATFGGWWAVRAAVPDADADPGWAVIDEVAGQWIAMLALPRVHWTGVLAAFLLFRLFDIAKPGPIGWADRQPGAFGIMADDVLAGLAAAMVLWALWWTGIPL